MSQNFIEHTKHVGSLLENRQKEIYLLTCLTTVRTSFAQKLNSPAPPLAKSNNALAYSITS